MNNNRCVICNGIIPEGVQVCPNCYAVSNKPKEKILIEMDINAVPSEMTAVIMLRLIENFCRQYGKRISVDYEKDKLFFEDKNKPLTIPPLKLTNKEVMKAIEKIEKRFKNAKIRRN